MKKQKFYDWLYRNDISEPEFYVYLAMAVLAVIWVINWICHGIA